MTKLTKDGLTHAQMVKKLSKPGVTILATLTALTVDLWHHASCIPGEAAELFDAVRKNDKKNISEELGDNEFYLEGARSNLNITREETLDAIPDENFTIDDLPGAGGDLFDAVKKHIIYSKPIDRAAIVAAFGRYEGVLAQIRYMSGISYEESIADNIDKLDAKRYPNGYTDEAAQARADKQSELQAAINKSTAA